MNRRTRVILLIDTDLGVSAADLAEFNVDGVVISKGPPPTLLECVKSVQEGRPWLDPDLLHHIAGITDNPSSRKPEMFIDPSRAGDGSSRCSRYVEQGNCAPRDAD